MTVAEHPLAVRLSYSPHRPQPRQHAFLWLNELEAMYGGAAGGGKSDALLMGALQYVDVPGYAALLLRKTYADLALPGALMDRARAWLTPTDARWSSDTFRWTFPSGATVTFGYLQTSAHRYRYASAEFQFIGFDELTGFEEADYRFLFSRLRRPAEVDDAEPLSRVPLRMRAASNPGGRGHAWVKRRFVDRLPDPDDETDTLERARRRVFIPAKLADNAYVDAQAYRLALANLPRVERERLLNGDWNVDTGDRIYPGPGVDAALALGAELDYLAAEGRATPPEGDELAAGLDHGDNAGLLIGWPLESGGLYVCAGEQVSGMEPAARARRLAELAAMAPHWVGEPAGREREPLALLRELRYDAAGLESQRTTMATLRRRAPFLRSVGIPFGSYKREAITYLRLLMERAELGERTRVLAISPSVALLADQCRNLTKDPKDPELPLKPPPDVPVTEQDHLADALVALVAPIARRNRAR